jgi:hypothetical protein
MGDSSGSVSIDVERIFFGGKVRSVSVLGFLPLLSSRLGWVHSCVCAARGRVWFDSSKPWGLRSPHLLLG